MQDRRVVHEKAVRLAIRTGWTPDLDLIWDRQQREGFQPCFGSFGAECGTACRWREDCVRLSTESTEAPMPVPGSNRASLSSESDRACKPPAV